MNKTLFNEYQLLALSKITSILFVNQLSFLQNILLCPDPVTIKGSFGENGKKEEVKCANFAQKAVSVGLLDKVKIPGRTKPGFCLAKTLSIEQRKLISDLCSAEKLEYIPIYEVKKIN